MSTGCYSDPLFGMYLFLLWIGSSRLVPDSVSILDGFVRFHRVLFESCMIGVVPCHILCFLGPAWLADVPGWGFPSGPGIPPYTGA